MPPVYTLSLMLLWKAVVRMRSLKLVANVIYPTLS